MSVQVLKLKLDELNVDPKFQRPLNEKFVQKMVDNYDEKMVGALVVNKRFDGTYSLIDGQHRKVMLQRKDRKQATCVVFEVDVMEEGKLFVALQKERRPVSAIEQHNVLVNSKDELAVRIDRVTRNNGFTISGSSISAIQRIRYMAQERGWDLANYNKALSTISQVWGVDNSEANKLNSVMGMWMLYERADLRITVESATDAFLSLNARVVARDAKIIEADHSDMGMMGATAWVLAQQFNKHNKLKGAQKIERYVFTNSFRTKKGTITRKANDAVNTGSGSQNEIKSPFSFGDE